MNVRETFRPTFGKLLLTILLVLILPNFAYWSCCLESPYQTEYKIHLGYWVLLLQTGLIVPKCGKFAYFLFLAVECDECLSNLLHSLCQNY